MQKSNINSFEELLKRGNLPDDDRVVPNWMKIKNRQFDDVDSSSNSVDTLIALSSPEFNEFVSSVNHDMLFIYLSMMSDDEMQKFYQYLDDVVTIEVSSKYDTARKQFETAMSKVKKDEIPDEQKARATLETPLMINYAKHLYHKIMGFTEYVSQDYYNYDEQNEFKMYEGHLSKIIWDRMDNIPDHFEQVIDHFYQFYDEANEEHKKFFVHLSNRFGLLIATLNRLVYKTQERATSLNWFTSKMDEYDLIGDVEISISQSKTFTTDKKLINFLTTTFAGICDENDDNYLSSLVCVVETLFEWYPVNREACEYAMVEMMKSVAVKKVNVENANSFIEFFGELPRFYEVLSYDKTYELKELINHTLANHEPQDNEIFDNPEVKNKIILLNYLIDMEDLYYESGKENLLLEKRYTLSLAEYVKLFAPFASQIDLLKAGLYGHPVVIDKQWDRFDSVIKDRNSGTIGWEYPVTASIFDMTVEMPVEFEKNDGSFLSVGVPLELVELRNNFLM